MSSPDGTDSVESWRTEDKTGHHHSIRVVRGTHHTEPLSLLPWIPVMPPVLLQNSPAYLALSPGNTAGAIENWILAHITRTSLGTNNTKTFTQQRA